MLDRLINAGIYMQGRISRYLQQLSIISICILTSCQTHTQVIKARYGTSYDRMQKDLHDGIKADQNHASNDRVGGGVPRSVRNALMPGVVTQYSRNETYPAGHRFNISADKIPAKTFFTGLVEGTPINMVVDPNVTGVISVNLKNVTIEQTMQAVHDAYGYEYKRTAYGYEILPPEMQTILFSVNYLDMKRIGKSYTEVSSGEISQKVGTFNTGSGSGGTLPSLGQPAPGAGAAAPIPPSGSSVETRSEVNFWKDLDTTLKSMVGTADGRSVVTNPQAGVVIVHALPKELHRVGRYLDRIQANLGRQVILEAKILEVTLNDEFQSGINWNVFGIGDSTTNNGGMSQTATNIFSGTDIKDFNTIFTLNAGKGSFNLLIKLLQTQGNVQVLSSPRLSTVNNQKAVIKVGQDEFFVTGVSTQNTVTPNTTIPTQDVSLTPFFSGITFDVTPQISKNETITLHIHPSVSLVKEQEKSITLGQTAINTPNVLTLPLALSTIRESDNIVRAKNGQVIVIGGLMQNNMVEETAGIPGLSRIPFLGTLFKRTFQTSVKTELVILLKPTIVNRSKVWAEDLEDASTQLKTMRRGFHTGGLPDVFGNDGELDEKYKYAYAENAENTEHGESENMDLGPYKG